MTHSPPKQRLLYLISEDWYFCSHRLKLAQAASDQGFEVAIATRVRAHGKHIQQKGIKLFPLKHFRRTSINPVRDVLALIELVRIYRKFRPDVVHHVAIKPVLYGSLVARICRVPRIINALAGMGYLFTSKKPIARTASQILRFLFSQIFRRDNTTLIVQNQDDLEFFQNKMKLSSNQIALIRGSGVDIQHFQPAPEPEGVPIIVCAARMLTDKGIADLVQSAKILARKRIKARIWLCGPADDDNPAAIPADQLHQWEKEAPIEWMGAVEDMAKYYTNCHIAVLPSYREGLPKSLLEAAAAGLPIVTNNVPGCREVVENGRNGLLVPAQSPSSLAEALGILINHPKLRQKFGRLGRQKAVEEFADSIIVPQTLALYGQDVETTVDQPVIDAA